MATSQPQQNAPKVKRYRALTPIDFNNKRYEIGKPLPELDEDTEAQLLSVKAIELVGKTAEAE